MNQHVFYKGDKLLCIDSLDEEDGTEVGYIKKGDVCVMEDNHNKWRTYIIVTRPNGKSMQLEARRFVKLEQ